MTAKPSGSEAEPPPRTSGSETRNEPAADSPADGHAAATRQRLTGPVTEPLANVAGVVGHPPTEAVGQSPTAAADVPAREIVRYGPGIPATASARPPGPTAEQLWRTGQVPGRRRRARGRGLLGSALTVVLLAASGVVLYLRFYHPPFQVTGVTITQRTPTSCGFNVTGMISTNGSPGTVSYQWLFQPSQQPPQPQDQSVIAGQRAVYVTVSVQGTGHGSASQTVTLQVLGPDEASVTTRLNLNC